MRNFQSSNGGISGVLEANKRFLNPTLLDVVRHWKRGSLFCFREPSMARRLIPSLNRVLVEKIIPPSKTSAGILLPEKTTKLNSGKVIAIGPGTRDRDGKLIPVCVSEGDTVLLPEYGGTEVKLGEKEYLLCRDDDILGTLCD